jgi:hypothetical protein
LNSRAAFLVNCSSKFSRLLQVFTVYEILARVSASGSARVTQGLMQALQVFIDASVTEFEFVSNLKKNGMFFSNKV